MRRALILSASVLGAGLAALAAVRFVPPVARAVHTGSTDFMADGTCRYDPTLLETAAWAIFGAPGARSPPSVAITVFGQGTPISGARVSLTVGTFRADRTTGTGGRVVQAPRAEGAGTISVTARGYRRKTVSVEVSEAPLEVEVELEPALVLRGVAVDEAGTPIDKVSFRLSDGAFAESNDAGLFELSTECSENCVLSLVLAATPEAAWRFDPLSVTIADAGAPVRVVLRRAGARVRVVLPDSRGLGSWCRLARHEGRDAGLMDWAWRDGDGSGDAFEFVALEQGRWLAYFQRAGETVLHRVEFQVADAPIELTLPRDAPPYRFPGE